MIIKPTNKQLPTQGLYAITDAALTPEESLVTRVSEAIGGGAVMIQYRNKTAAAAQREREAHLLTELCRAHQVPLIVNDDVELAHRVGAHGVHLGESDLPIHAARALLGDSSIIGVSCYNDLQRALHAQQAGADYVAFGSFFASSTKAGAVRAALELLSQSKKAKQYIHIPIVAIGGITPENGGPLVQGGANLIAACHGVFGASDIHAAAQKYASLFVAPSPSGRRVHGCTR